MEASLIYVDKPYIYAMIVDANGNDPYLEAINTKEGEEKKVIKYPLTAQTNEEKLAELLDLLMKDKKYLVQIPFQFMQVWCQMFQYNANLVLIPLQMPNAQEVPTQDSSIVKPKSNLILPTR